MPKRGKKYKNSCIAIDRSKLYELGEAVGLSLKAKFSAFDESLDIAVKLGVDPRHADQMVRSTVILPNGTGKTSRVLVFAKGEKENEAREAGADFVGSDELVAKIQEGWLEFDKVVATPDMMGAVGRIGRILGPRNLMPNAKLGTVTFDVGRVVGEIKKGKVDFRVDKAGIVHAAVGKVSLGAEKLNENICAFIDKIMQVKPATSKGIYLKAVSISTTMGPSVKVDPMQLRGLIKQV